MFRHKLLFLFPRRGPIFTLLHLALFSSFLFFFAPADCTILSLARAYCSRSRLRIVIPLRVYAGRSIAPPCGDFRSHRSSDPTGHGEPNRGSHIQLLLSTLPNIPHTNEMSVRASDVILILVAIIFPPAAAFFVVGCGCDLLINILLTM